MDLDDKLSRIQMDVYFNTLMMMFDDSGIDVKESQQLSVFPDLLSRSDDTIANSLPLPTKEDS